MIPAGRVLAIETSMGAGSEGTTRRLGFGYRDNGGRVVEGSPDTGSCLAIARSLGVGGECATAGDALAIVIRPGGRVHGAHAAAGRSIESRSARHDAFADVIAVAQSSWNWAVAYRPFAWTFSHPERARC